MSANHFHEHARQGTLIGWLSIMTNVLLFVLKYVAGILSGSVALIADAWHTLTDSLSSIVMIVGIRIARKPADERHPFGHGRAEWIASMMIGFFLFVVAYSFVRESVERLSVQQEFDYGVWAWIATIASIVWKEGLAQVSFRAARKTKLKSLKADGWHHRTDALSSVIVLVGLIIGPYFWWVDGVLGILVSLMIAIAAIRIMMETSSNILGEKPDEKTVKKIYEIVNLNCQKEVNLHHIRIHEYGHHRELTAHIKLPAEMSLEVSHRIATAIEDMIEEQLHIRSDIHVEPIEPEKASIESE